MTEEVSLKISLAEQRLTIFKGSQSITSWPVSTARNGPGEQLDSGCTPRGMHRIRIRIGADCPVNTVFVGRRPTGEIYSEELGNHEPGRDWILTRILWLGGMESGRNRGGSVDTLKRYIYIHGCPDDKPMGVPMSHGCIRMRNDHIKALFEQVHSGTLVEIRE